MGFSIRRFAIALAVSLAVSSPAWAQAYCALRDPTQVIHDLFPGDVSVRSQVRTVTDEVRQAVSSRFSGGLRHSELGQHTVYAIYREDVYVGYVHPRSEKTRWGIVEIAWALDADLAVRDFRFQRCRDPSKTSLESQDFRAALRGAGEGDLRSMLDPEGAALTDRAPAVSDASRPLAIALIRSALRTIIVTDVVWGRPDSRPASN